MEVWDIPWSPTRWGKAGQKAETSVLTPLSTQDPRSKNSTGKKTKGEPAKSKTLEVHIQRPEPKRGKPMNWDRLRWTDSIRHRFTKKPLSKVY